MTSTSTAPRCPWAIAFGVTLRTRCALPLDHNGLHDGPGLRGYPNQRIRWIGGDTREYQSDRDDAYAWTLALDGGGHEYLA